MSEVTINGIRYRIGKLDAFKEFHISRRLAPVLIAFGGVAQGIESLNIKTLADVPVSSFGPVAEALGKMSDADSEYVLKACLGACQRDQGAGVWAPVRNPAGTLMFEDMDMPAMMRLTLAVIQENMGAFFRTPLADKELPSGSPTISPTSAD